tara:strand:- start:488 stop:1081 length:594 start_codon:yes stop_codon:yes gene_type:complete
MNSLIQNLRSKLLTGIVTLLPLYLTYIVLKFILKTLNDISEPILNRLNIEIPLLGILLTLLLVFSIGIVVTNFLGKKVFEIGEKIVKKVPLVSSIYLSIKQILNTITNNSTDEFKGTVYIQYPRKGLWTMAFISGESTSENGKIFFHLFVPTTPNPTSGFFLMIPKEDAIKSNLSVEDGLKAIISGGLLAPKLNPLK